MPAADPAAWKDARFEWETTPTLTMRAIAEKLGVSLPTVSIRAKKELWVKQNDGVILERLSYTPKEVAELAIRTLVRACTQSKDPAAAVKAAGMLLDRTMGRVTAEQTIPLLPPEVSPEEAAAEEWPPFITAQRLAYRAKDPEALEPPPEPAQLSPEPETEPEPAHPTCPAPERPVLRVVEPSPPRFWSSPSTPFN